MVRGVGVSLTSFILILSQTVWAQVACMDGVSKTGTSSLTIREDANRIRPPTFKDWSNIPTAVTETAKMCSVISSSVNTDGKPWYIEDCRRCCNMSIDLGKRLIQPPITEVSKVNELKDSCTAQCQSCFKWVENPRYVTRIKGWFCPDGCSQGVAGIGEGLDTSGVKLSEAGKPVCKAPTAKNTPPCPQPATAVTPVSPGGPGKSGKYTGENVQQWFRSMIGSLFKDGSTTTDTKPPVIKTVCCKNPALIVGYCKASELANPCSEGEHIFSIGCDPSKGACGVGR